MSDEIDALFSLPLDRFVAERDLLAKKLRSAGLPDRAREVKALKKPAPAAWVLNQLAREDGSRLRAWIDATEALRVAQIAPTPDVVALRRAQSGERAAIEALRDQATRLLEGSAKKADRVQLERVVRTFRGAALSQSLRADLERGRLIEEQAEQGFDVLGAMLDLVPSSLTAATDSTDTREPELEPERAVASPALTEARRQAELAQLRARIEEARLAVERTGARARHARNEAARLEQVAVRLREAFEEAQAEAQRAAREATTREAELASAERALAAFTGSAIP